MTKIELLRSQHEVALAMADRLLQLVEHHDQDTAAIPILMQLNRLLGLLRVHLAYEDVQLYPALMASSDAEVVRIARRHVDEVGGLAIELECFARHWSCAEGIAANIDEFRDAAHGLILALAVRIDREDLYLFPMAEAEARRHECKAA